MVTKTDNDCVFRDMQANGLKTPRSLSRECFTLTSAMGLGGGYDSNNSESI